MSRRLLPLIVGSLLIIAVIAYISFYRSSPGDLAKPHAQVAGSPLVTDCRKCHAPAGLNAGCLQCHSEIQEQLSKRQGYHSYLQRNKKVDCGPCHSDHNGASFEMINKVSWENKDPKTFTHPETKFRLSGNHQALKCQQCHSPRFVRPFALPKFPRSSRKNSYLGLTQDCVRCHADIHAHGLAADCESCHGQEAWKPTPHFNHDPFFPLKGGHAQLHCDQCHVIPERIPAGKLPKGFPFNRVKGGSCQACHASPHFTPWVERCDQCHHADDRKWSLADARMTASQHAKTGFRLIKPHDKTSCAQCHAPALAFAKKYPNPHMAGYRRFEQNCESCHKDEHRGQFVKMHPRCMDCHTLSTFRPSTYTVRRHVTYRLAGGHFRAACNACHIRDKRTGIRQYVPTPKACAECHRDIHVGQFRRDEGKTTCEECHKSAVHWKQMVFNHDNARFKLDQAHVHVACALCHPTVTVGGARLVQYKPLRFKCRDCHDFDK